MDRRFERACHLLAHTNLPVTEVCWAVGYESPGSFSTWFQRFTAMSPREWRQRNGARHEIRKIQEADSASRLLHSDASA